MEVRDKHALFQIKQKFGGSVKLCSGDRAIRYRLHHKSGLITLINAVNGEIRNPTRILQLNKLCDIYGIVYIHPKPLDYFNGWFSGFFDSVRQGGGSIYINLKSSQMYITCSQKNRFILDPLPQLYGGKIYADKTSFKWIVYKKEEILNLLNYFHFCPSRSAKMNRLLMVKKFFELRNLKGHVAGTSAILNKPWINFLLRWDKWEK